MPPVSSRESHTCNRGLVAPSTRNGRPMESPSAAKMEKIGCAELIRIVCVNQTAADMAAAASMTKCRFRREL